MRLRIAIASVLCISAFAPADTLTLPEDRRPAWLARDGIVMAGSWEPLLFRVRRDGSDGYTPTAEQRVGYEREHSAEMVAELKSLGVNFVMMHCYKAFGPTAERESMADAVRFSKLCHDAGLRVGVYNNSGTLGWELLYKELPQAAEWIVLDAAGKPVPYGRATYRYYWNRNHPDAQAFHHNIARFAVNEIKADLLHFDNYNVGPGSEPTSAERFRQYLRETFTPEQRERLGIADVDRVQPAMTGPRDGILRRAWLDFACKSLADSYVEIGAFARTLRADILLECNPGGPGSAISPPVDHGRLLRGGEAFWDEGEHPAYRDGQLRTRIRTYKIARRMENAAFAYATTPLEMAELMAFNRDCLGCICWFEYGKLVALPGSKEPVSPGLAPFTRFFHARRNLLRDAEVIADVAVLRSFPSQVFAGPRFAQLTAGVEQRLIEGRVPFQIIYDCHLDDLERYRALVLAGCVAMSDRQIERIRHFAESGGRVCIVGAAATHDEWMLPRAQPGLGAIPDGWCTHIDETGDVGDALRRACPDGPSVEVRTTSAGLCAEYTRQPKRWLVHLVNYRLDAPAKDVAVTIRLPKNATVRSVTLVSPERATDTVIAHEAREGVVTFAVPSVGVYEIAVVEFALKARRIAGQM